MTEASIKANVANLLHKARQGEILDREELIELLKWPAASEEAMATIAAGGAISREISGNKGETHAQFALNLGPCKCNCVFCSFAQVNGIFTEETRITLEEALEFARNFETQKANAIYVMTTAGYSFGQFIEFMQEVRQVIKPETPLIANVGDKTLEQCKKMQAAGITGVYHAIRIREGVDSDLAPEARKRSIRNFQEAGLKVGTCVEPLGPEQTPEEIADAIVFSGSFGAAHSGAARRITIPGTEIAKRGMISELRMAQIVAITRLGVPRSILGHCTHEPCALGAVAGANLFWAEVGANPRDIEAKTEKGRGHTLQHSRDLYGEADWEIFDGSSRYFTE
ncbi:MAG: radical SAM protein [Candidatus Sumerlaeota bacterium]